MPDRYARYRLAHLWRYNRYRLFLSIVCRDFHGARIGARTAWDVATIGGRG